MLRKIFVKVQWEFPTAGHLVFWKPYPWVKILKNMLDASAENLSTTIRKPLFRIAWHFWTNTKYSGEVSLIISVDIHRELTQCVRTWIFSKCRKHWDFTLCPSSTVASTFNPRQYLQSLEIPKQISYVLRGIKRAIPRKLVKISDCRVSSFLKTVPGCRVSRHFLNFIFNIKIKDVFWHLWWNAEFSPNCAPFCVGFMSH